MPLRVRSMNPVPHDIGSAAYTAGKRVGSEWRGRFTAKLLRPKFDHWVGGMADSGNQFFFNLDAADTKALFDNFYAGARWGWESQEVGPYPKTYGGGKKRNGPIRGHHRTMGLWPSPGVIDTAINKRAQAMARSGKKYTRAESDAAAERLVNTLFGRNAVVPSDQVNHIKTLLWNDYGGYDTGYRGFHLRKKRKSRNPRSTAHRYEVRVPSTRDIGSYLLTITATTKSVARKEARAHCSRLYARATGKPMSKYRLPSGTKVKEIG